MKGNLVDVDRAGGGGQHPLFIRLRCLIGKGGTLPGPRAACPALHSAPFGKERRRQEAPAAVNKGRVRGDLPVLFSPDAQPGASAQGSLGEEDCLCSQLCG